MGDRPLAPLLPTVLIELEGDRTHRDIRFVDNHGNCLCIKTGAGKLLNTCFHEKRIPKVHGLFNQFLRTLVCLYVLLTESDWFIKIEFRILWKHVVSREQFIRVLFRFGIRDVIGLKDRMK